MAADVAILSAALLVRDPYHVLLSILGAVALNFVIAVNHRPGRYAGTLTRLVVSSGGSLHMRVWAVANQKGGVGKTTTTVALAGLLGDEGKRASCWWISIPTVP